MRPGADRPVPCEPRNRRHVPRHAAQWPQVLRKAPVTCAPQREGIAVLCDGHRESSCPAKWTPPRSPEERHEGALAGSPICYTRRVPASAGRNGSPAHMDCNPPRVDRVSSRVTAAAARDRQDREARTLPRARGDGLAVAMGETRPVRIRKNGEPVRIGDRSSGARRAASEGIRCSASS